MARVTRRYEKTVRNVWRWYGASIRACTRGGPSPAFEESGYVIGCLGHEMAERIRASVQDAPTMLRRSDDARPGFRWKPQPPEKDELWNVGMRYYVLTAPLVAVLEDVASQLAPPVREAIGSPWRIAHTRVFETLPSAEESGQNAWHKDNFPFDIRKVLVYATPVGAETGTTEIELENGDRMLVEGPPGTWVLFKNSELVHRGLPPTTDARLAVEFTFVPSMRQKTTPVCAGLGSSYPTHPLWWSVAARWTWERVIAPPVRALDDREAASAIRNAARAKAAKKKEKRAAKAAATHEVDGMRQR